MITFVGFMIPGLYLESDYCVWVYIWKESSIQIKQMSEIWIVEPDDKKVCYIDPKECIPIFNKYHNFDEVIEAKINVEENKNFIKILVSKNSTEILRIEINTKSTLENCIVNLFLKSKNNEKLFTKGKTETGKTFINKPEKIVRISDVRILYNGKDLGKLIKPRKIIEFGDGRISKKPMVNYCTHNVD